ncbi:8352_t:CDS:1, partial [Dentiscutata erythropus]
NAVPFQHNKRATKFNTPCQIDLDPLTVVMKPDPPVGNQSDLINVSGTLTEFNITANQTL